MPKLKPIALMSAAADRWVDLCQASITHPVNNQTSGVGDVATTGDPSRSGRGESPALFGIRCNRWAIAKTGVPMSSSR